MLLLDKYLNEVSEISDKTLLLGHGQENSNIFGQASLRLCSVVFFVVAFFCP